MEENNCKEYEILASSNGSGCYYEYECCGGDTATIDLAPDETEYLCTSNLNLPDGCELVEEVSDECSSC